MAFPVWLRQQMNSHEWSVTDLARRLEVNHGTISMWLSGQRHPNARSVRRLADTLGVDEDSALIAAGHKSPDRYLNPDSPTARLSPLIEKIDWGSRPGRLEEMENELRFMIDTDRRRQLHKKNEG